MATPVAELFGPLIARWHQIVKEIIHMSELPSISINLLILHVFKNGRFHDFK